MAEYRVSDIAGKMMLVAKTKVPYKKLPLDSAPIVGYFQSGSQVGIPYALVEPKPPERTTGYWMFDKNYGQQQYYVAHKDAYFGFKVTGVTDGKSDLDPKVTAPQTWQGVAVKLGVTAILIFAGVQLLSNTTRSRSRGRILYV